MRGVFLCDLLQDHVVRQNTAASNQVLLAESPGSLECFQVFTNVTEYEMCDELTSLLK